MESKSDNHAIVLEGEAQEKIGRNIASFFDKVIDSIKESIRTRKSTKKKASDSDKNLAEIANLLKEPYTHIASLVKTDMALISPTYSIYQRLLEHGLRQNPPLSVSDLKEQMMQVSYADNIHTSISQKEKKTIEYIISFVKDSRAALSAFGVSMNPSLFVLGDQEIIFLQTKIATLKNTFTEELKKLENLQNVFMQYGNEIQESVLTQLVDVMQSQRCYKKINDICYLSALNIIFDLKADGEEAAQALVAFKDWARQYDKVYWECLPQYKKEIDILSNDVASVIVHHYKVAHGVFMTSKAKMDYINHIENILTEHYLDKKREIKVSRVNSYENALK